MPECIVPRLTFLPPPSQARHSVVDAAELLCHPGRQQGRLRFRCHICHGRVQPLQQVWRAHQALADCRLTALRESQLQSTWVSRGGAV